VSPLLVTHLVSDFLVYTPAFIPPPPPPNLLHVDPSSTRRSSPIPNSFEYLEPIEITGNTGNFEPLDVPFTSTHAVASPSTRIRSGERSSFTPSPVSSPSSPAADLHVVSLTEHDFIYIFFSKPLALRIPSTPLPLSHMVFQSMLQVF
jgi:hypothetical protein